jgi:VanZ family protein
MPKIAVKKFLPGIAWFLIVVVLTCMPGNDVPKIGWLDHIWFFDKWVHAGLFGGLTFLFCWPFKNSDFSRTRRLHYFIKIALASSIFGLMIEFIQRFFIPGRDYELLDWAADTIGSLLALLVCLRFFIRDRAPGANK